MAIDNRCGWYSGGCDSRFYVKHVPLFHGLIRRGGFSGDFGPEAVQGALLDYLGIE